MAAPNFAKPVVGDNYADVLPFVVDNVNGVLQGLDPDVITGGGTPAGTPTNAIRWRSANKYWEKYNGTTWVALESAYGISITGNAGTVTNGVVTSGSYANPGWITSLAWAKLTGTPTTLAGYGIGDGITAAAAAATYAPLTGTGASGTWSISISGNAATVTTNANLTGHVTSVGNATVLGSFTLAQLNTALSDADVSPTLDGTTASTFTFDGTGGTSASVTMTYQKVGNFVKLHIPAVTATSGTSSTVLSSDTALPAAVRPVANQHFLLTGIKDAGNLLAASGLFLIGSNGVVRFYKDAITTATFTNSSPCGVASAQTFTYFIG